MRDYSAMKEPVVDTQQQQQQQAADPSAAAAADTSAADAAAAAAAAAAAPPPADAPPAAQTTSATSTNSSTDATQQSTPQAGQQPAAPPTGGDQQQQQQPADAAAGTNQQQGTAAAAAGPAAPYVIPDDILKTLGVASMEELQNRLKTPETPEQIAQRTQAYTANVDNYAITQNLIKRDEIMRLEALKTTDNSTVAYEDFAATYKAKNEAATDDAAREAFENYYHIGSANAELAKLGQEAIDQRATQVRNGLQDKYDTARSRYDTEQERSAKFPAFRDLVSQAVNTHVPESVSIFKKGDAEVTLQVSDADRAELNKLLLTNETFNDFLKPDNQQHVATGLKNQIDAFILIKNRDAILDLAFERGKTEGTKAGSNVGAQQPFALNAQGGNSGQNASDQNRGGSAAADLTAADLQHMRSRLGRRNW